VVRLNLDDRGKVRNVKAISGQEILIEGAMANAKKWQFEPNSRKAAFSLSATIGVRSCISM
jgi:hypothetical protein